VNILPKILKKITWLQQGRGNRKIICLRVLLSSSGKSENKTLDHYFVNIDFSLTVRMREGVGFSFVKIMFSISIIITNYKQVSNNLIKTIKE